MLKAKQILNHERQKELEVFRTKGWKNGKSMPPEIEKSTFFEERYGT
jgi:hypothetical protein